MRSRLGEVAAERPRLVHDGVVRCEGLQIGTESGQPDAALLAASLLGVVSFQRGTYGELAPLLEQVATDHPALCGMASALALSHVEAGRLDDARALLEEAAVTDFDIPLDPNWLWSLANYAGAAVACRHLTCVEKLFDRLAPWADQMLISSILVVDPVSHYLGGLATVLGRFDEAETYFTRAAYFNSRAHASFFAARTDLWWGAMLVERKAPGDAARARDLLTKGHAAAVARGYANVERRSAEALQRLDERSGGSGGR